MEIGGGIFENGPMKLQHYGRSQDDVKSCLTHMRNWWARRRSMNTALAGYEFLHGSHDGVHRPYMVETAVIKFFEHKGVNLLDLREALKARILKREKLSVGLLLELENVWSTFEPNYRPAAFKEWCWRSGTKSLSRLFNFDGDCQFRLNGRNGWGIMPLFQVSENIMWVGGPGNAIWIRDQLIPQSIMTAAKGRPVTDVIEHPAFDVPGLKITGMQHVSNKQTGKMRTSMTISAVKEDATLTAARMLADRQIAKAA